MATPTGIAVKYRPVTIWATQETADIWNDGAARAGLKKTEYFRRLVNKQKVHYPRVARPELVPLLVDLSRLGNNLNRIARRMNTTNTTDLDGLKSLLTDIFYLLAKVRAEVCQ